MRIVVSGVVALLLISCFGEKSVHITYDLHAPVKFDVMAQSHYATMDGETEHLGTRTRIYFTNEYSQNGEMLYLDRTFISDASEGYLKRSYPPELAYRTPHLKLSARGLRVMDIEGYEDFDSAVVAKVAIPDRWRKQISRMTRQMDLDRIERRRWEITHLLLGKVPLNKNITEMLESQGRLPVMPNVQIDSVVTKGFRKINGQRCFEYSVFLQEKEPFPYFIWEQHVNSVRAGAPFKGYHPKEAVYQNRYDVALNLENGLPCREYELKYGTHGMQHPETGDSVTFKSQVSHERFYNLITNH
ncbi:MAG: hypothetical protein LBU89_03115 [Fibromonadaceae bacterium]|jgi:hypothetical protein|nr:hypothetical protein [Fibromonadaceae bacterium]